MNPLDPRVVKMVKDFVEQDEEVEAFLTGPAGSGKTTELRAAIDYLNTTSINYMMVAYTHQAKDIIISKMPKDTNVRTLHSWLKKRPGINEKAKHIKSIMTNHQQGKPERLQLLIVDEFSFVGEDDYMSIGELQDELYLTEYHCKEHKLIDGEYNGEKMVCEECGGDITEVKHKPLKVLYVGDLNQLSPIKGPAAVVPGGDYWVKLTKIHRSTTTISEPLQKLVSMIEGTIPMSYLEPTENFIRGVNIDQLYNDDPEEDKCMYAFTNKAVQAHNAAIQGYAEPKVGDTVWISSLKIADTIEAISDTSTGINELIVPGGSINSDTKYNPMDMLAKIKYVKYYTLGSGKVIAGIFGVYNNKKIRDNLGKNLVAKNKSTNAAAAKKAYREFKTVNDYVCILDFNHCMTIHKSQGSEVQHSYVDSKDLGICQDKVERMKLLYVAMSRSKHSIFMSN